MDPVTAIAGAIAALPDLIKLVQEVMSWINTASGGDPKGYVAKLGVAMKQLNDAQTDEDRQNAAKAIADAISGL